MLTSTVIIHHSLAKAIRFPEDEDLIRGQDYAFFLRLTSYSEVAYLSDCLVHYALRPTPTITETVELKNYYSRQIIIFQNYLRWVPNRERQWRSREKKIQRKIWLDQITMVILTDSGPDSWQRLFLETMKNDWQKHSAEIYCMVLERCLIYRLRQHHAQPLCDVLVAFKHLSLAASQKIAVVGALLPFGMVDFSRLLWHWWRYSRYSHCRCNGDVPN